MLSDDEFTYDGTVYRITAIIFIPSGNTLSIQVSAASIPQALLDSGTFHVGDTALALSGTGAYSLLLTNSAPAGLMTAGTPVTVSIRILKPGHRPAAPRNLGVSASNAKLDLTWNASVGATGYDVHYTSLSAGYAPDTWPALDESEFYRYRPGNGWVALPHTGTTASQTISGLTNGTAYRVRVRAKNAAGVSDWVVVKGTPAPRPPVTMSFAVSTLRVVEGNQAPDLVVKLSRPLTQNVSIPITVTRGSAELNDFGLHNSSLPIPAGQTSGSLSNWMSAKQDDDRDNETVTVSLPSDLLSGKVVPGSPATLTVTAVDDDGLVNVSFAEDTMTLCEGGPQKYLPELMLSRRPDRSTTIWLTGDAGTAEPHDHTYLYAGYIGIQRIPHAWHASPYAIRALPDAGKAFEQFTVEIDESRLPDGFWAVDPKKVTVTIVDDDLWGQDGCNIQPPRLSVKGDRGVEWSGGGWIDFTVSIDRDNREPFTVQYRTEDVTAVGGQDYTAKSGTLSFGPYQRSQEVRVHILDDDVEDSGETFKLVLHRPQGAVIENGMAIGTILNDDGGEVQLTAAFELAPARHDGSAFWFDLRFNEPLGATANAPSAASFTVQNGSISRVWKVEAGLWRLQVAPETRHDVTVTLKGGRACDAAGAVCTVDGRALSNSPTATVAGPEGALSADADLSALSVEGAPGADGSWTALGIGTFAAGTTAYSASVENAVTHVRLTATASEADATLKAGAGSSLTAVTGGSASAAIPLAVGANALKVEVTAEDGTVKTYVVTVEREAPPLTARLRATVSEHDGETPFMLELVLSESLESGSRWPSAASFDVKAGSVESVRMFRPYRFHVHVKPKSWRDVTVESLDFAVTLNRAAAHEVSVDYATADETATAGADYTATSGTLVFTAGETAKTVSVPVLDDAIDEGKEVMRLLLSNPRGAYLRNVHRRARGIITNDDALQQAWLSRFGRTVGGHVTDAVSGRLVDGLTPGAHATVAGQAVDLTRTDDGKALADLLAGLGQRFGAQAPANDEDPFSRSGLGGGADSPASALSPSTRVAASSPAQTMTGRELLLGSAFHLAGDGDGAGPGLAAWGRAAQGRFDGEADSDTGRLGLDGEVLTGTLGADADFGRMLAGVAVSLSEGDGTFDDSGATTGAKGTVESTMTTVSPYARLDLTERVSAWGLGGWGTGAMTLRFDDGTAPVRTDLSMRLGALGARGALLEQDRSGGMDLALKADAFFVTTESDKAASSAATTADASRLRLVLEGGRSFDAGGGATVRPSLELGVRHDGGDAETGSGLELGGGVAFTDPSTGLGLEAKARMLLAHADSDYEEWGVSATARLDPGERGRGLSFSLAPTIGATSSASERLWGAQDARALAPDGGAFEAGRGLQAEAGYGMALFGDRFTGMPNLGFGLADGGARDWRLGWRLTSAVEGDPGFEVSLDAIRREAANDDTPEHGLMLRSFIRW